PPPGCLITSVDRLVETTAAIEAQFGTLRVSVVELAYDRHFSTGEFLALPRELLAVRASRRDSDGRPIVVWYYAKPADPHPTAYCADRTASRQRKIYRTRHLPFSLRLEDTRRARALRRLGIRLLTDLAKVERIQRATRSFRFVRDASRRRPADEVDAAF